MLLDLKAACRELLKNRWFTCVTVLTLALGIGANTAIFGVVNKLLLNPLPYADSERLFYPTLRAERAGFGIAPPSIVAKAWREQAQSLDGIESFNPRSVLAYDANGARVVFGMEMTFGLPGFFGISPVLGRAFTAADAEPGAPAVVMFSYEAWQREHGGASDVLGRVLTLEDKPHVVVGVMPARWESFARGRHPDLWFPMVAASTSTPGVQAAETIARLRPDVDVDASRSELDAIAARAMAELPQPLFGEQLTTRLDRPSDRINGSTRDALLVLLAAVGLVLLVACSNVANLLLARSASRARELAVRSALGASTWRLVRALAAECLVLALAAGVTGIVVGWVTLRILVQLRPNTLSALAEVELDVTVLAFTFGVSALTAVLFGVGPALQLNSRKVGDALRHGASGVVRGGSAPRLRKLLVAAQMGMSVVLLVGAGLLVRSFIHLQNVDVGFDTQNLFTAQLTLPPGRYQEAASREALSEQLADRVRGSPGVAAVTESLLAPAALATMAGAGFEVRGRTLAEADARAPRSFNEVRPDYFAAVGIRLVEGRTFTADEARAGGVLLVNEAAARHFWPDGGALGGEVRWGAGWTTVIGITSNVISGGPTQSRDEPKFYLPFKHESGRRFGVALPSMALTVRAAGDAAVAIASVRVATREIDPEIAITNVLMTETAFADSIQGPRFNMALLTAFAVIALVLAGVGLAAVIGYEVTERTHEFGIRMALGAQTENVRRLAMRHGLTPAFVGLGLGVIGALAATQLAASMLYGITPRDPLTFVGVVALLVLVALGASWLPARRATRVDPIAALRAD